MVKNKQGKVRERERKSNGKGGRKQIATHQQKKKKENPDRTTGKKFKVIDAKLRIDQCLIYQSFERSVSKRLQPIEKMQRVEHNKKRIKEREKGKEGSLNFSLQA